MRKVVSSAVFTSFALVLMNAVIPQSAGAGEDHLVKVACSAYDGDVIGADTTSLPGDVPLVCGPCSPGNQCVACLGALIENGCKFDEDMKALYLDSPEPDECRGTTNCAPAPAPGAVLYQLIDVDGDCIQDVCETQN